MPILAPFEAFARDAVALNVEEDESRLPIRWLAAAQVAARLADARGSDRKRLLATWIRQQSEAGAEGVWSALSVPGMAVRDLASASAVLCRLAEDMERGGALNLAYATVTNMRIAMLERGPAGARGAAAWQQARILRQMGLLEEAQDTYECAQEDAVRAGDTELEARALLGLAIVAGQRGNYPGVREAASRALKLVPADSPIAADAHNDLMIAAMAAGDYAEALEHGWKGYDAAADAERRAAFVSNLGFLALRSGRFTAARRGLIAALQMCTLPRIQIPALGGLALISAVAGDRNGLKQIGRLLARLSERTTAPYELARASFELAQAWEQVGERNEASQSLARARELASEHGFHEVAFRSDVLADALRVAQGGGHTGRDERVERSIARFDELQIDEAMFAAV